jgi:FMN-dependent oxidoreductase (nitrilotriacetate monooxygenase family)
MGCNTMKRKRSRMVLNFVLYGVGSAYGAWRSPRTLPMAAHTARYFSSLGQLAEEAKFHSLFLADFLHLSPASAHDMQERLDPLMVLANVAADTNRIGLIATASTTYGHPYTLARQFASLDHLSSGRAGWNIVTTMSPSAAANFGRDEHPEHDDRYRRADEFVRVVKSLWDSWDIDAIRADRGSGEYIGPGRVKPIDHHGQYFDVRGPLNVPRPPQGRPVLVQAGSSSAGIALAAHHADIVFTTQFDPDMSRSFIDVLSGEMARAGRQRTEVAVLPGLMPVVGRTRNEARKLAAELTALTTAEEGMPLLRSIFGDLDFSKYKLDAPFPDVLPLLPPNAPRSRAEIFASMAKSENLSLREVTQRIAISSGHRMVVGSADDLADDLQNWFEAGAADGFNILPALLPDDLKSFAEHVVPRLQDRGLFQTDYGGATLRDNLERSFEH